MCVCVCVYRDKVTNHSISPQSKNNAKYKCSAIFVDFNTHDVQETDKTTPKVIFIRVITPDKRIYLHIYEQCDERDGEQNGKIIEYENGKYS